MKSKIFFTTVIICIAFLTSCFPEVEKKQAKPVIDEKEFLNHEILNDSIVIRIKEIDKRNHVIRNLCVFKNDEVIGEALIYKHQKKEILDEGYNTSSKKSYEVQSKRIIRVFDITTHHYDYKIESIDTNLSNIEVTNSGEIKIQKLHP